MSPDRVLSPVEHATRVRELLQDFLDRLRQLVVEHEGVPAVMVADLAREWARVEADYDAFVPGAAKHPDLPALFGRDGQPLRGANSGENIRRAAAMLGRLRAEVAGEWLGILNRGAMAEQAPEKADAALRARNRELRQRVEDLEEDLRVAEAEIEKLTPDAQ